MPVIQTKASKQSKTQAIKHHPITQTKKQASKYSVTKL
jgi:hypothetical protein